MTGQIQKCALKDGCVVNVHVSEVEIDLQFFSGIVVACCFDNPSYDLILGVRKADDSDIWWIMFKEATTTVQTRNKSKKRNPSYRPMRVPSALAGVSPKEFVKEQQTDTTIDKLKTLAKIQKAK